MIKRFLPVIALVLLSPLAHATGSTCKAPASADADVTATLRAMYAAARTDDLAAFHAVTTPDFYAFDGGQRFDGDALMNMVKSVHAEGTRIEWSVTQPEVEADCRRALITFVNVGSITMNGKTQPVTWLEAAELHRDGMHWRIHFFTSARVPAQKSVAK
jgi:ketosteroid isomerase-like protein